MTDPTQGALAGRIAIVTGANTGIGKETARGLAQQGATVVLACRDAARGEAARAELAASTGSTALSVMALDLADVSSVKRFAADFEARHQALHLLVNNAGVWATARAVTAQGHELTFGVNHLGTHLLTTSLAPLLKRSAPARVVVVSSALHYRGAMAWDDLMFERRRFSGTKAYNQSKLANVLFTRALARRLQGSGVTVNAVHPGLVATELSRSAPALVVKLIRLIALTPEEGARCSLHVAASPALDGVTGEYFEKSKVKKASKAALDEAAQEKLWAVTEALLGHPTPV